MWKRNSAKKAECTASEEEWNDSFSQEDSSQISDSSCPSVHISSNESVDETEERWIERIKQVGIPVERHEFEKKFEELGMLGKGAYGHVCVVSEKATGRNFAMKRVDVPLNPSWLHNSGDNFSPPSTVDISTESSSPPLTQSLIHASSSSSTSSGYNSGYTGRRDPVFEKLAPRLLREVHAMASLGHHQHLVKFYTAWLEVKACAPKPSKKTRSCTTDGAEESSFSDSEAFLKSSTEIRSVKNEHESASSETLSDVMTDLKATITIDNSSRLSNLSETTSPSEMDSSSNTTGFFHWNGGHSQLVKSGNRLVVKNRPLPTTHILTLFIQMELCSSESLHSWLRNPARLSVDRKVSLQLFSQLLSALTHMHEKGFFHRDIKPDNLMMVFDSIRREPTLKLGDFGLSKQLDPLEPVIASDPPSASVAGSKASTKGGAGAKIACEVNEFSSEPSEPILSSMELIRHTQGRGTAMYMAPELWSGKRYDEKVDVYAAGIVLYELFHCFTTGSERIASLQRLKEERDVGEHLEQKHPEVARLVLAMTHPDPDKRPRAIDILSHPAFAAFQLVDARRIIIESDGESEEEDIL